MKLKKFLNKRIIRGTAQILALLLVVLGIAHTGRKAAESLSQQQTQLESEANDWERRAASSEDAAEADLWRRQAVELRHRAANYWRAEPFWLLVGGGAYALGMVPAALFWRVCLRRLDQPAPLLRTFYAYFLGHLGKYFPGKAMVLVLRVGVLLPLGVLKVATTLTIFMETLTMMAVGSALSAVCLLCLGMDWRWTALAWGLMLITFLPTLPPILRIVLKRTQPNVEAGLMTTWLGRIDWQLLATGWFNLSITWLFYGASLYCVLCGLPAAEFREVSALTIALSSLGACAMAVVLGFVSFLPGGAGVREVVLSTMLAPVVGPVAAMAAAVWLRVVWLAAELLVAAGLWAATRVTSQESSIAPSS